MAVSRLDIPLRGRVPAQGRRYGRLVWLELRFSYALLLMPLAVGVAIWFFNSWMWQPGRRWDVVSSNIAQTVLLIGPASAMWASFVAQREGNSRLGDLTSSLPVGSLPRHLLVIGTPVAGSVLAYATGAAAMFWWHGRAITWGAPNWALIGFGALVVLACAMVGAAFGQAVRGRFAPVIASGSIFLYFVMSWTIGVPRTSLRGWALLAYPRDRLSMTSPLLEYPAAFRTDEPPLSAGVAICVAVIATAMAGMVAMHARWRAAAPFGVIALVGFLLAAQLATITPTDRELADRAVMAGADPVANPPLVCREGSMTICLHQIDARDLDQASRAVDALLGPIQGLPGVPSRIEMRADLPSESGVLRMNLAGYEVDADQLSHKVLPAIFDPAREGAPMTAAEQAIAAWLMRDLDQSVDAGFLLPPAPGGVPATDVQIKAWKAEIFAAADRFAALSPEEQRAWLGANWETLRAGDLTLEDLP